MIRVSDIAAAGMAVAQARLTRSAHNVANINTDGFEAERERTETQGEGGVTLRTEPTHADQPVYDRGGQLVVGSNTDLAQETVAQIGALNAFKANLAVLRTDDEMQRSLLHVKA